MGSRFRELLESKGFSSAAADGWKSPTVIVSYGPTDMVAKFASMGLQIAGKVPFKIDEPSDISTFRVGLFGLNKLYDPDFHLEEFGNALDAIQMKENRGFAHVK